MNTAIIFDPALIRKYDKAGPRYTSYPTAVQFHNGFGEAEYREQAQASNAGTGSV
jgi:oxygen-independent coproporphyrinogen-3 oxidase